MSTRRAILGSALALGAAPDAIAANQTEREQRANRRRNRTRAPRDRNRPNDARRPHVFFLVLDDMADAEWVALPEMRAFFAERGAAYPRSICANPVCAPARASLLTGRRSDHTGVLTNEHGARGLSGGQLFPALRQRGYRTAGWGKTLNGYRGTLAGFDQYDRTVGSENNQPSAQAGWTADGRYLTDYYRSKIRRWLAGKPNGPVALYLAPNSPHKAYVPHPDDVDRYPEVEDPERRVRLQMLAAVDRMFTGIIGRLADQDRLDQTLVVVCSDNGFAFGHNGVQTKGGPYRPSTEVAMRAAGPGIEPGATDGRLVAPEDVPVTIAAAAGTAINGADGVDFRASGRPYGVMQYHSPNPLGPWWGLRFPDEAYIEFADGRREFFDLGTDPGEQTNRYLDLAPERQDELAALLAAERRA